MSGENGSDTGETGTGDPDGVGDVKAVLARAGFDPEANVLTRRQAEVYVLRERGLRQREVAELLGTSRANVASVEASARENVRKAHNTVAFADVLAAPVRVEISPSTPLYEVPQRIFTACDEVDIEVNHTAPELMEMVKKAAGEAVAERAVTDTVTVGVSADGEVSVRVRD